MDRQSRNDYEARATAVQQHIRQLVDELARLRDMRSRTRPSATDSLHRLLQLHAEIRPVTQLLRTNIHAYLQASRDWDNAVSEFRLHEDRSSWAQSMLQQRHLFFHGLSISTMTLDFQFAQLLHDYTSTLDDIEAFIRSDSAPADAHSAATPFTAPAAAHSAANGTVSGSNTLAATHSVVNGDRQPGPARRRSSSGIRPVPATQFYRKDGQHAAQNLSTAQDASRSTSHRSAAAQTPAQQSSSRSPSSGQVLTYVNSSRQRRTAGIMAHADGDISHAIPLAWQPTNTGGPVYSGPGRRSRTQCTLCCAPWTRRRLRLCTS